MKVYCPTCGNDHNEQLVTCSLCGAEFDIAQTKLAVKNQIMKRAIKLWQEAEEPAIMEGHFLDQAEESLRLEMEAKTIKFMCKMATDASDFMKQAAGFCKLSTNEAQAYDWSYNANDFMSKALGLVNLIKNKVAPQAGNASIRACRAKPLQAKDMPPYPMKEAQYAIQGTPVDHVVVSLNVDGKSTSSGFQKSEVKMSQEGFDVSYQELKELANEEDEIKKEIGNKIAEENRAATVTAVKKQMDDRVESLWTLSSDEDNYVNHAADRLAPSMSERMEIERRKLDQREGHLPSRTKEYH